MLHPNTELKWINDQVGKGVIATEPIPKGTIVWTQCEFDIVLAPSRLASLPEAYRQIAATYGYVDRIGDTVLCWDLGRYVNHACEPTMLSLGAYIEICVRDLMPGDELTCDYGTLNYNEVLECRCGHPACRVNVHPEDALAIGTAWKLKLESAVAAAALVAQPLLPFLKCPEEWQDFISGKRPLPTPDAYYFDRAGKLR